MTIFDLQEVPPNIPKERLLAQAKRLANLKIFSGRGRVVLTYLGGITNHGLKDSEQNLFVRIPGINATHFINRVEELDTLEQLAHAGLYPHVLEAYAEGDLEGYKVEPFIEGETLQFIDFFEHQYKVLPALKALHDAKLKFSKTYDIFEQLLSMCTTLVSRDVHHLPFLTHDKLEYMSIDELKAHIHVLQDTKARLFSYPIALVPCHNDITPTNFIKLKYPVHGRNYQLIDWEYAGMNDSMYDVAGIAAMLGMPFDDVSDLVCHYFNSDNAEMHAEEIKRVKFYMPLVKLYYAVWATLQVSTGNESTSIDELKSGWGPGSLTIFLEQYHSESYQALGCVDNSSPAPTCRGLSAASSR